MSRKRVLPQNTPVLAVGCLAYLPQYKLDLRKLFDPAPLDDLNPCSVREDPERIRRNLRGTMPDATIAGRGAAQSHCGVS